MRRRGASPGKGPLSPALLDTASAAVQATQRERLQAAMVDVAARHGYANASVARIIERAGVSRATFYTHFADRERCFLAAYREIVGELGARLRATAEASAPSERHRALLELLLGVAAAHPSCARLVLVEALGAGPATRAQHARFVRETEAWIERQLALDETITLQIPAASLLGALSGPVSSRLLGGEAASLPGLFEPLLDWLRAYELDRDGEARSAPRVPTPFARPTADAPQTGLDREAPALLPRGRSALPEYSAAAARRERVLAATAVLISARGYTKVSVDDIVSAARVSRRAFYSCFRGKQDAFLASQTKGLQGSIGAAAAAFSVAETWPDAVWQAGEAMLSYVAAHPALTYLATIEVHAVGEAAIRRNEDSRMAYGLFLERGYVEHRDGYADRQVCTEAIAGAVLGILRRHAEERRLEQILAALPEAVYVILTPFLGPGRAMDFVEARVRAVGRGSQRARERSLALADRA